MSGRMQKTLDSYYMSLALDLALRGTGKTAPNPRVGCVIIRDGRIQGRGYHQACGLAHAEAAALEMAGEQARGATLYVNLEPCSHHGKTPPCTEAIIKTGVSRVVAAMQDPDPRVSGRGFARLRGAGVEVDTGICRAEAEEINKGFVTRVKKNRPWVTLKAAMTMDGRIAQEDGWSKWISNRWSRTRAHLLRASHDALLVGVGTVVADDPKLNIREVSGHAPRVVVLDPSLRTPSDASLFGFGSPLVVASNYADPRRARDLKNAGA
ncbi:MAG: bifunctional diaminohydroxyphosphoribosylaminopyrimidine deaminase/5-amino-6-(5-phosphoribosylamino)uracil reductase RibD, partial [Thermovirgaceae bacterium]